MLWLLTQQECFDSDKRVTLISLLAILLARALICNLKTAHESCVLASNMQPTPSPVGRAFMLAITAKYCTEWQQL